jgi:hypothetical protein
MQTRRQSAIEAATNILVGYGIAVLLTATVLPLFGYPVNAPDALGISLVFTAASLARSYLIRRAFNRVKL